MSMSKVAERNPKIDAKLKGVAGAFRGHFLKVLRQDAYPVLSQATLPKTPEWV